MYTFFENGAYTKTAQNKEVHDFNMSKISMKV